LAMGMELLIPCPRNQEFLMSIWGGSGCPSRML
jgi:hypothetical protein